MILQMLGALILYSVEITVYSVLPFTINGNLKDPISS